MIKKYKKTLLFTSLLTLLPILVGLILWDQLPERFATHWGMDGQADGWSSLPFAVFVPPLLMLAVQWLCIWFTSRDPGNKEKNEKPQKLVLWIIPVISNICCGLMYALALGAELDMERFMLIVLGLMFVIVGNYLPKCRQNSTIGIKVPWVYTSEENWNATHRFGGKVWVIGGLLIVLSAFLPGEAGIWLMLGAILALTVVTTLYSYLYYRKQKERGDALIPIPKFFGKSGKTAIFFLVLILIFVCWIMFTGDITIAYGETAFTIEASFHEDLTVEYATIDSIEYREGNVPGTRVFGFGSPRLMLGTFENPEFGTYTRYTYTNPDACIILTSGEKILVISSQTPGQTYAIYLDILFLSGIEN